MLDIDFTTSRYKVLTIPTDEEGNTHAVITLDDEDNVVVFSKANSREAAEAICKEKNRADGHVGEAES